MTSTTELIELLRKTWPIIETGPITTGQRATIHKAATALETLQAENERLRELLLDSTSRMEVTLSAMDKYNERTGKAIVGPSLLGMGKQIAANRAALEAALPDAP